MQPNYFEPWHRRHPVAFIVLMVTTIVLVVLVLVAGSGIGLLILLAHALSDPVPVDKHDERTVLTRLHTYSTDVDAGSDVSSMWCARLVDGDASTRWFPPGPRSTGNVTIAGDAATVVVTYSRDPKNSDADPAKTLVQFRYESGVWRYCGVS